MADYVIAKDKAAQWLRRLADAHALYAPGADGLAFEATEDGAAALLPSGNTRRPPKELFLPPTQRLLQFRHHGPAVEVTAAADTPPSKRVLVGVRPCDAAALRLLDTVFAADYSGFEDPYYACARAGSIIVSLLCSEPLEGCFCGDAPEVNLASPDADVALTDLGDRYFAQAATQAGADLIAVGEGLFQAASDADRQAGEQAAASLRERTREGLGLAQMQQALRGLHESSLWRDLSATCVRCGTCTFLCPTCHCFDLQDEARGAGGYRYRCWDTCQFSDFTLMTSGENPRREPAERLKQRLCHKLEYLPHRTGKVYCVGCGRCVRLCPVGIDLREVIEMLAQASSEEVAVGGEG